MAGTEIVRGSEEAAWDTIQGVVTWQRRGWEHSSRIHGHFPKENKELVRVFKWGSDTIRFMFLKSPPVWGTGCRREGHKVMPREGTMALN